MIEYFVLIYGIILEVIVADNFQFCQTRKVFKQNSLQFFISFSKFIMKKYKLKKSYKKLKLIKHFQLLSKFKMKLNIHNKAKCIRSLFNSDNPNNHYKAFLLMIYCLNIFGFWPRKTVNPYLLHNSSSNPFILLHTLTLHLSILEL